MSDTILSDQREENAAIVCSFEKLVVIDQNKRLLGLHKQRVVLKRFE